MMKTLLLLISIISVKTFLFCQDGLLDLTFDPGTGTNNIVNVTRRQSNGQILIGGSFTSYNGTPINRIARLNSDGSIDNGFNIGTGANSGNVFRIEIQSDEKIVIVGTFTMFNGISRNGVARLNPDGSLDNSFDPGTGVVGGAQCLALQNDGKIIIGNISNYNGTPINGVARLNSDGSLDPTFNVGGIVNNAVNKLFVQTDGKILVGGNFTVFGGSAMPRIVRLNSNGSIDPTFLSGSGVNSNVMEIAQQPDNKLLLAGGFTTFNGGSHNRIVRLNEDGTIDAGFSVGTGANGVIYDVEIQPDGKIIIAGEFTVINGISSNRIARLNSDGSFDTMFNPMGSGANNAVNSIALQPDGKIIIAGRFTSYNGTGRNRVARLSPPIPLGVDFEFITAHLNDQQETVLNWKMNLPESLSDRYQIQHHRNNTGWTTIGEVSSTANNSSVTYQFLHETPDQDELNYYRIKYIKTGQEEKLSEEVAVQPEGQKNQLLLYPNPASTSADLRGKSLNYCEITLMDLSGKEIPVEISKFKQNQYRINVETLANGYYAVIIKNNTEIQQLKLLVQH